MERLSSSDDEEMGEEELTGLAAKMERQAKLMKQRVGMEDEEHDEEDEEEKQRAVWGRGKKIYYGADNANRELESSDEELAAEEEEVARQAQQEQAALLRNEDFDFSDSDEDEETFEEAAQKKETKKAKKPKKDKVLTDGTIVLQKDISALSKAELMEVLMSDAPELVGLQTDLHDSLNELRLKVQPLLEKVKGGKLATEDGLKYLELKHMLLLSYCQAIVFYFLLKAEMPQNVRDHPVVRRLVDLKLSLERLRPVEEKLQKQIDKLMTMNIVEGKSETKAKKASSRALKKAAKAAGNSKKRKASEEETANGTSGQSEEEADVLPIESQNMMNERKRLDARVQEDVAARVPSSNAERKKTKRHKSSIGLIRMADDLDDEVERDNTGLKSFNGLVDAKPKTLSQVIAQAGKPFKKPQIISGDADLPVKEDLGDRRRKLEIQKTNKELANMGDESDENEAEVNESEEDDFYKQAVLLKEAKLAAKQAKYSRTILTPVEEEDAEGKRSITWQMEKNRGLTPHRKKANKNPRKKYKLKHEKAVIRRKGQVREIRQATTNYGGEASGIRTNISRSVRFKN